MVCRSREVCSLPDELRCKRSDNSKWRCRRPRVPGSSHCEHHRNRFKTNHLLRKLKNLQLKQLRGAQVEAEMARIHSLLATAELRQQSVTPPERAEARDFSVPEEVAITRRNAKLKPRDLIRGKPGIQDSFAVPPDITQLKDLSSILSVETWNECMDEEDRIYLAKFLPRDVNGVFPRQFLRDLLEGKNINFGNQSLQFGENVCKGLMKPGSLVSKQMELKESQKKFYSKLKEYHSEFLKTVEQMKKLFIEVGIDMFGEALGEFNKGRTSTSVFTL